MLLPKLTRILNFIKVQYDDQIQPAGAHSRSFQLPPKIKNQSGRDPTLSTFKRLIIIPVPFCFILQRVRILQFFSTIFPSIIAVAII